MVAAVEPLLLPLAPPAAPATIATPTVSKSAVQTAMPTWIRETVKAAQRHFWKHLSAQRQTTCLSPI